ncbi:MAG TPA: carbohydrate ABC transporter permease [Anaerolineales bacterium]|nr:carbohydrate ABC transporter permease [Anaerolineales bacterium]
MAQVISQPHASLDFRSRMFKFSKVFENIFWYIVLIAVAIVTAFPFLWVVAMSFKGPTDPVVSVPPQFIPQSPTFDNYVRVWKMLPMASFFMNSIVATVSNVLLNVTVAALAAYPFAKMKFRGRDAIFYFLLSTLVVPAALAAIPSFILAVKVFHYRDQLISLVLPNMVSVFNIFLLRQAFKAVPNDLIDAAKMDGAGEFRIWWSILLPIVRPSLAAAAINQFVFMWNEFFWAQLMLPTMTHRTLPVGLLALQSGFVSDSRGMAAGVVITVVPILIFFILLQKQFTQGLAGAVKG